MRGCTRNIIAIILAASGSAAMAQFELSDARTGMTCHDYQASLSFAWYQQRGDWRDANDVAHGDEPFARQRIARTRTRQVVEWDITGLARLWEQGAEPAGGIYLRQMADPAASAVFYSREAKDVAGRPQLVIDRVDGSTTTLSPEADATMTCTSVSGNGTKRNLHVGNHRSSILVFPFDPDSGARVDKARLVLTSHRQYRATSDVGVFRLFAPFTETAAARRGLAAAYPRDVNIESHPAVVFATGFESSGWLDDWSSLSPSSNASRVERDEANRLEALSGDALEVTIKKGTKQGLNLLYRFKEKTDTEPEAMYFRYYVRFGDDWTPKISGKMPGFAGTYNEAGWGGRQPDGTNGWSARGSYRLSSVLEEGHYALGSYVYHAKLGKRYGDSWGWNRGPTGIVGKNRWYSVEQYLRLNTPGKADGVLRAWIDGVPIFERTDIHFRDTNELRIETLWMNVYHGGTSSIPSDSRLYIDNVVIATEYIGPAAGLR